MLKKLFLGVAMLVATAAFAQDNNPGATVNPKDQSETGDLLITAGQLVKYGYRTKSALPLIQAVEIYNRLGVTSQAKDKETEGDAVTESDLTKANDVSYDVTKLLADATQYADGDKNLLALIKATGETRGRVGGPVSHSDKVKAGYTDVYTWTFRGGEPAIIAVSGDGDTDLDLFVYDSNGNLITSDTDAGDDCLVMFTPRWTGSFKVKIKNYGRVYNSYAVATN